MSPDKSKSRGAAPHADYFLYMAKESNQRNATPVCRPSGSLDQPQASGAAQLDLAGRTPRAPLRDSNITSDLAGVVCQLSRMASCFISARPNLRFLAADRGGAQGMKKKSKTKLGWATSCPPAFKLQHGDEVLIGLIVDSQNNSFPIRWHTGQT
jgi:hypothetical protein